MATKNANDGISMLATAENAASDVTDMLQRMRELAVQAANDVNGASDRTNLKAELDALVAEIDRVGTDTEFNNTKLFDGNHKGAIQVGADAGQTIMFDIKKIDSTTLSINSLDISGNTVASAAITSIDNAITTMATNRANYGAVSNRLDYTVSNLMNVAEYTASARSRIEDADFAAESARLAKAQVLQQTGTAMLAQANASQQLVLSLFR
jgi:flagellin